ncbi:hypothetical protein EV385_6639 [Krasilnikovia cinnamomea]|uniref:Uncharacterized protein n=1 Tax=Krasilnikovia cinnamomea TaxID=349313 RepID=A0A4Q7Z9L3_9ACTN|nr:hypothetical protein EV385_6639 [Krasilnikovia cinnamomea]
MPIHLPAPAHRPGGPDGRGWNRLSLNAHIGADRGQCALRPLSYPTLVESQDTRRARWGGYGPCVATGDCRACPVPTAAPRRLDAPGDRVLVRLRPGRLYGSGLGAQVTPEQPVVMADAGQGWQAAGEPWSWHQLARVAGWRVGRPHRASTAPGSGCTARSRVPRKRLSIAAVDQRRHT